MESRRFSDEKLIEMYGKVCTLEEKVNCLPHIMTKLDELRDDESQRKGAAKTAMFISGFAGFIASVSAIFTWFKS